LPTCPISWSNHPASNGVDVTVKTTGLLSFMPGRVDTSNGPEVAPFGMLMVSEVELHEFTVATTPFKRTTPLPCVAPKFDPLMVTWLPIDPVVAETLVITGAGFATELTDTPSQVPLYNA